MAPLCPKNQSRSWYWGNDSSWPESKVPATYKYNPPKWKGLSLVFSWTQACYPILSLGFGETESPYTGQLRRAPPPRCPASHLAPAAKVRAARADWRLPGAAPLPLAARASLFQVPAAAESGCGSSRARCVWLRRRRPSLRSGDRGRWTEPLRRPAWTLKPK